jgi:hypothetical protein
MPALLSDPSYPDPLRDQHPSDGLLVIRQNVKDAL